jgi:hypothetical protein
MLAEEGYAADDFVNMDDVRTHAVAEHAHTVKDGVKASEQLIERSREVIDTIDYLCQHIKRAVARLSIFYQISSRRSQRTANRFRN